MKLQRVAAGRKVLRLTSIALIASAMTLSGCTSPVQSDGADIATTAGKTLPFSYDATVDQFTHMSCTNMPFTTASSYSKSAYFSYRLGAYRTGGVSLTDSFYTTLKKYRFQTQSEILAASPANQSTVLQLAARGRLDYQNIYSKSAGNPVANQDYMNMLTDLGQSDITPLLVNNPSGSRIRQIRNGSAGGYRMEGSLYYTDNANLLQATRDFFQARGNLQNNAGLLAVTYTNGGTTSARSAADTVKGSTVNKNNSVYGRGYLPVFEKPSYTAFYSGYPENVVTSMTEQSLDGSTLSPAPQWACPQSMQLRIIRDTDLGVAGASDCRKISDPKNLSPDLQQALALVRNTMRVEDWYIDIENHCAIAKRPGLDCYGTRTDIKYSMTDPCGIDPSTGFSNCVQHASTCYRKN